VWYKRRLESHGPVEDPLVGVGVQVAEQQTAVGGSGSIIARVGDTCWTATTSRTSGGSDEVTFDAY